MSRYIVIEESLSVHCCFEATVVDTKGGCREYGETEVYKSWNTLVCECLNKEHAYLIAECLNNSVAAMEFKMIVY